MMDRGAQENAISPPRRQSGNEPHTIVTLGAAILGGQVDVRMAAGPWWAGFLLAVLGIALLGVRIVFPQDSPDKVAWWCQRWRTSRCGDAGGKRLRRCAGTPRRLAAHRAAKVDVQPGGGVRRQEALVGDRAAREQHRGVRRERDRCGGEVRDAAHP